MLPATLTAPEGIALTTAVQSVNLYLSEQVTELAVMNTTDVPCEISEYLDMRYPLVVPAYTSRDHIPFQAISASLYVRATSAPTTGALWVDVSL